MSGMDMQDFQNRGEPYRRRLGIDGTAGDAQDVPHGFVADPQRFAIPGPCVVCGLGFAARVHRWPEPSPSGPEEPR